MDNQTILSNLLRLNKESKLHHALLLTGNKENISVLINNLAKALICNKSYDTACNECKSCKLFESLSHPDIFEVELEEKNNFIKIEQIRNVNEFTDYKQQISNKKLVIINQANKLNISASNALLKTLEEPNSNTIFILTANNKKELLPTIVSRCLEIKLTESLKSENDNEVNSIFADIQSIITNQSNLIEISSKWVKSFESIVWSNIMIKAIYKIILYKLNNKEEGNIPHQIKLISKNNLFAILDGIIKFKRLIKAGQNPNYQIYVEGFLCKLTKKV